MEQDKDGNANLSATGVYVAQIRRRLDWALEDNQAAGGKLLQLLADPLIDRTLWEEISLHLADVRSHLENGKRFLPTTPNPEQDPLAGTLLRFWPAVRWSCPCGNEIYATESLPDLTSTGVSCTKCDRSFKVAWHPLQIILVDK